MTAANPTHHVPFEFPKGPRMAGVLELAAPLALGARGLIIAPARTGATTMLMWMAKAALHHIKDIEAYVLLLERPVEEPLDWQYEVEDAQIYAAASESSKTPEDQIKLADDVLAQVETAYKQGKHVLLLIDSISSLARALATKYDSREVLMHLRQMFGKARANTDEEQGSLTIIGTLLADTSTPLDEALMHELVSTGNVEWHLDNELMRSGLFPPVDLLASGARHSELIIGEKQATKRGHLRALCYEQGKAAGLALLLEKLDLEGPLKNLLDSHAPGAS